MFGNSNPRVKEIVPYFHISSYCKFSEKDLQFWFTLGAAAVSEMNKQPRFLFPDNETFGKFHHGRLFGYPTLCYFNGAKYTVIVNLLRS